MVYSVVENVAYRHPQKPAHPPPDPVEYEKQIYQRGLQYEQPRFTFQTHKWEALATEQLSADSRGYVAGNAGTGETAKRNREAFGKWSIVPRRLVKTDGLPDLSTQVLGQKHRFPIAIAPVGVQCIFNPDGELASAAAAAVQEVPYVSEMTHRSCIPYCIRICLLNNSPLRIRL